VLIGTGPVYLEDMTHAERKTAVLGCSGIKYAVKK